MTYRKTIIPTASSSTPIQLLASLLLKTDNGSLQRVVWYCACQNVEVIEQIIREHLIGNRVVEE